MMTGKITRAKKHYWWSNDELLCLWFTSY